MSSARRSTVATREPLLEYLIGSLGLKRKMAKNLLGHGAIAVNGVPVRQFDHALAIGDEVAVSNARTAVAAERLRNARIRVAYDDESLIVVEKPAGLLTVATEFDKTDTLFVRLNEYLRGISGCAPRSARVVHRLDRETSGLVLFAKSVEAQRRLQAGWPEVEKIYLAIVVGRPEPERGTLETYLSETTALTVVSSAQQTPDGQLAVSHYRVLQSRGDFSLVEVRLETGRKHQIRVHLAGLSCVVAGDRRYGAKLDPCRRLALHAQQLSFAHPTTGQRIVVESRLPMAMHKLFPTWGRSPPHDEGRRAAQDNAPSRRDRR